MSSSLTMLCEGSYCGVKLLNCNMKLILLKVNHILFWWYYRRVSDHFKQYTFFKSISLLRQHYEHAEFVIAGNNKVIRTAIEENNALRKENSQLRIQQIATDGQIRWANQTFGMDWTPPTEN